MNSVWVNTAKKPVFSRLSGDINTDVLVIGGGMAGVLTAYKLSQNGAKVTLLEAKSIGFGITKNTTAKITAEHSLICYKIMKKYGVDTARLYLEENLNAINEYRLLSKTIDCDFIRKDAFVYTLDDKKKIDDELLALQKIGYDAKYFESINLPFSIEGAICFKNQAQFNPLKFLFSVAENLEIYENTAVKEIVGNRAITDFGTVTAKNIVVATHFPFMNKHGNYFLKMYQERSYVIAIEGAENLNGMFIDENKNGLSFRNYKDLLFIGGGNHKTGKSGADWNTAEKFAKEHYKNSTIKYKWATEDCMTLDGIPYIGRYSKSLENIFVITGFNKWGMTSSMLGASILTDMILEKRNDFEEVFSPSRSILQPQLLVNSFNAFANIATFKKPRCPHLGCALKWNKSEHSWDCPCHGSRFEEDGTLIDNPATDNLDLKKY